MESEKTPELGLHIELLRMCGAPTQRDSWDHNCPMQVEKQYTESECGVHINFKWFPVFFFTTPKCIFPIFYYSN